MKLTEEQIKQNAHIPTSEIEQDIADTEAEIIQMTREAAGYDLIGDRMSRFRADARRSGIRERKEFIDNLRQILEARKGLGEMQMKCKNCNTEMRKKKIQNEPFYPGHIWYRYVYKCPKCGIEEETR